jgi:hypothetical protein
VPPSCPKLDSPVIECSKESQILKGSDDGILHIVLRFLLNFCQLSDILKIEAQHFGSWIYSRLWVRAAYLVGYNGSD